MTTDTKYISAISLLTQVIEAKASTGADLTGTSLREEIDDWLPIFRSKANFAAALDAVRVALDSAAGAALCDVYLSALLNREMTS